MPSPDSPVTTVEIKRLVVGLPLNTLLAQTVPCREMVEGKHTVPPLLYGKEPLTVVVRSCTVVAQPQGAMISYGANSGNAQSLFKQNMLVLDIGGGTFDWYLSHGKKALIERCGAYPKGMLECAFAVCDRIDKSLRGDPIIVSRVDEALRRKRRHRDDQRRAGQAAAGVRARSMPSCASACRGCSIKSLKSVDLVLFSGGQRLLEVMAAMHPSRVTSMKLVQGRCSRMSAVSIARRVVRPGPWWSQPLPRTH